MEIAENIKAARKAARITQKELATRINKSFSTVQKYELGITLPPIDVIKDIAVALNVDPFSIMDFDQATKVIEDDLNTMEQLTDRLFKGFGHLNISGKIKAVTYVEDLAKIDGYRNMFEE